ncbi:MAG: 50S ribosomal protein L11 [Hadesarchaea archaeon]|nr:50S ribosomal protein L11 [Hadesarchaea archaeon]
MEVTVEVLVDGGKASAGPPIGPALGPYGLNIGQVVAEINEKTAKFDGMKVPVKIIIDKETKEFKIEVGSPPVSALIRKELGLEKGASSAGQETVGDLSLEGVIKIARQKAEGTLAKDLKASVKEILGTCVSMGVTVEGKDPREVQKEIEEGKHDGKLGGEVASG